MTTDNGSELDSPDGLVHGMKGAKPAPDLPEPAVFHTEDGAKPAPPLLRKPAAKDTTPDQVDRVDSSASRAETAEQASTTDSDVGV